METAKFTILPITFTVDGVPCTLWEALKVSPLGGEPHFICVVSINYMGVESKRWSIPARDMKDLVNKLKVEITKLKIIEYEKGVDAVRRILIR